MENRRTLTSFVKSLLTYIAILLLGAVAIAIVLIILHAALGPGDRRHSDMRRAKNEVQQLEQAILACKATYSHWPMTEEAVRDAAPDFTYGTAGVTLKKSSPVINSAHGHQANNAEVVAIVMAHAKVPYNTNHRHNPEKKQFLNPKLASEDGARGVGPNDGVYRDPWGTPYIISIDVDGDGWTRDAFYSRSTVSQTTQSSRIRSKSGRGTDDHEFNVPVMIWSFGRDRRADPEIPWDEGVNADNVLSWR